MSLTPRQQFKFGFLLRCADQGLDAGQAEQLAKQACEQLEKRANDGALGTMLKALQSAGWYGLGASAAGGLGAGYGLAKLTEPEIDPAAVKKQELIAAYRQNADRIRRNMAAHSYRGSPAAPRSPRF